MPNVEDICIKNIVTVDINSTVEIAVKKMAASNIRTILVTDNTTNECYIFRSIDAIEYKIENLPLSTKLKNIVLNKVQKIDAKVSILELINDENMQEYCAVVKNSKIIGVLSQSDIINNIDPKILVQRQSIGNLILQYTPITVYKNEAAMSTIKLMKNKHVDAVIIIDNHHKPLGIFTTKDFLNIIENDLDLNIPIQNYMSSPLQTLPDTIRIFEALDFIKEKHFKRLIVTNSDGEISGLITQTELLRVVNNKWMELIKEKGIKLSKINENLIEKTKNLEKKASTDYLTKLPNRRKFNSLVEYELKQVQRYPEMDFSILIFDIDNFKKINDTFGHDIGDKILQELAKIVKISLRNSDLACRWGGEEFAIALTHTSLEDSFLVAQKIRSSVENHKFVKNINVTCSFGLSQFHLNDTYATLFKRADEALYEAKNTGKNKVVIKKL